MLVYKKKFKIDHDFCPFCGEAGNPFYDINPYRGNIEFEVAIDDEENNELKELYSINPDDWLLP